MNGPDFTPDDYREAILSTVRNTEAGDDDADA
jgi:hypothetical protein